MLTDFKLRDVMFNGCVVGNWSLTLSTSLSIAVATDENSDKFNDVFLNSYCE